MLAKVVLPLLSLGMKIQMSCKYFLDTFLPLLRILTDSRYDLKQMLQKSSISRVPEELRKHEAAQQKPTKGLGQKKLEDSGAFGGKGGWQ